MRGELKPSFNFILKMKKTYKELEKSRDFYNSLSIVFLTLFIFLLFVVGFLGAENYNLQQENQELKEQVIELEEEEVIFKEVCEVEEVQMSKGSCAGGGAYVPPSCKVVGVDGVTYTLPSCNPISPCEVYYVNETVCRQVEVIE